MNRRLLQVLLCALLLGLTSGPAWAICRSENRVGKIFPDSLKSASTDLDQTLEPRGENPGCGYDIASGLHKYLYAQDNPVMRVDPSGHDGDLISLEISTEIGASLDSMEGVADVGAELSAEETADVAVEAEAEEAAIITDNGFQDIVTENLEGEVGENTEVVEGQYKGGTGFSRPDILDKTDKVMTEIKSVKSQSLTKQIQIQISNVRNTPGWKYRMIFNAGKFTEKTMSGPLKSALKEIGAKVYTTIDGKVLTPVILD